MRKSRSFVRNIVVCMLAVMLFTSAFFYAPMEACASGSSGSVNVVSDVLASGDQVVLYGLNNTSVSSSDRYYISKQKLFIGNYALGSGLNSDSLYEVELQVDYSISSSQVLNIYEFNVLYSIPYQLSFRENINDVGEFSSYATRKYILRGSDIMTSRNLYMHFVLVSNSVINTSLEYSCDLTTLSITELSNISSDEYQNGYNAGYAEGESVGYGNGYSQGFTDGEASVDTDAIYDEAFQAGQDSVDTQSYYDAGYQVGYQVAYSEGYESGYDSGYDDAMSRITSWGADTSNYPLFASGYIDSDGYRESIYVDWHEAQDVNIFVPLYDWFDIDPNHTYKAVINMASPSYFSNSYLDYVSVATCYCYFEIGGTRYALPIQSENCEVFIPGDRMSTTYGVGAVLEGVSSIVDGAGEITFSYSSLNIDIYDCGPSGDTQNHIANQTDQLTNGFDSSSGDSLNNDLALTVNDYNVAEDSLFNAVHTGLDDFEFFDFESVPAMITGITFVTSIMDSIFTAMGGASGAGIVLSVLFSVVLGSIVLGLTRYFVSDGKGKKKGE